MQVLGPDSKQQEDHTLSVDAKADSVEVTALRPFTLYTFKVSAMTKAGTDGLAESITSTTLKEGDPFTFNKSLLYTVNSVIPCLHIRVSYRISRGISQGFPPPPPPPPPNETLHIIQNYYHSTG